MANAQASKHTVNLPRMRRTQLQNTTIFSNKWTWSGFSIKHEPHSRFCAWVRQQRNKKVSLSNTQVHLFDHSNISETFCNCIRKSLSQNHEKAG